MDKIDELNRLWKYRQWFQRMAKMAADDIAALCVEIEAELGYCKTCQTYYDTCKDHVCQPVDKE